jgi:uncharacterized protein (TIGR02246 family)
MTDDTAAVRDLLRQMQADWAAGDADAFASRYLEDATVVLPGVFQRGRAQVREFMAARFAGPFKGSRGVDEPQDIRILGDTAIVVSRSGVLMAGEQDVPADRVRLGTWVLARQDDRWQVAAFSNSPAH